MARARNRPATHAWRPRGPLWRAPGSFISNRPRLRHVNRATGSGADRVCRSHRSNLTGIRQFMNLQNDPHRLALMKFGIGQPVTRTEDPLLVRGAGCYTDDVRLADEAHAVIVRSRVAHGLIKRIDTSAARNCRASSASIRAPILPPTARSNASCRSTTATARPMKRPPRPALATDKVRFVGDPVAFVVAETLLQAKDAAEAVEVEIDSLPAVVNPRRGDRRPGAPLIHDEAPGNVALDYHYGDAEAGRRRFRQRPTHVTRLKLVNSRVVVNAMEPRAAVAVHDAASGRLHPACAEPGRVRNEGQHRGNSQGRAEADSHPDRPCRRLVRHEGSPVPGICLRAACRSRARPPRADGPTSAREASSPTAMAATTRSPPSSRSMPTAASWRCGMTSLGNVGAFLSPVAPMPSTLNTVQATCRASTVRR